MVRVKGQRHWLYAAVDPDMNKFRHDRRFQTRTTQCTLLFLRELCKKQQISDVTFLVDGLHHLRSALKRLGLRFRVCRCGIRKAVERVFRDLKRQTSSFSNFIIWRVYM